MGDKAEETSRYILEKVVPLFNKKGFHGTSMADITDATGLTKGAIYGNFKNKEELAIEAFNIAVRKIIGIISKKVNAEQNSIDKLKAMTSSYRNYIHNSKDMGGCAIVNKGMNTHFQQEELGKRVKHVVIKLIKNIETIISEGVQNKEINPDVNANQLAYRIYSILNGGVYMGSLANDQCHLDDMIDMADRIIDEVKF